MTTTRREFLKTSAAASLTIAFGFPELGRAEPPADTFQPNAYLRIDPDETITLWVTRLEMGQGVRTLLPVILAEELDADWTRVRVEQAWPGGQFKGIRMHTSGSSSSSEAYEELRLAAAAAREMLVGAAAAEWRVAPASCRTEQSAVIHTASNRRLSYGALAAAAARQALPPKPSVKSASSFRLLGKPTRRVDGPAIVTGRAEYGLDVRVPGLLFATVERAPELGATVSRFNRDEVLEVPGVRHVVAISKGIHPGVAVVATDTWAALKGRSALKVEWSRGTHSQFDSDRYLEELPQAFDRATFKVRHDGDAVSALASAARRHEATYIFPFQAHAPMEPMNCTADVRADRAEVWAPTQTDVRTLKQVANVTGLPEPSIRLHCVMMGGGFGRRLFSDYAAEAAEISKAIGAPVQVMWTREDDIRRGYFQPATGERFTAGLDRDGALVALVHKTTASDLTIYDIHEGRNIWTGPAKAAKAPDAYKRTRHRGAPSTRLMSSRTCGSIARMSPARFRSARGVPWNIRQPCSAASRFSTRSRIWSRRIRSPCDSSSCHGTCGPSARIGSIGRGWRERSRRSASVRVGGVRCHRAMAAGAAAVSRQTCTTAAAISRWWQRYRWRQICRSCASIAS